jgi:anti-anti-sigma factor
MDLQPEGERLVVSVRGELDESTGDDLRGMVGEVIAEQPQKVIVLDLSGVSFMDSRGLGQLISACRAVERAGRKVHVADPSLHAQRVLDSAGLSDLLREHP